MFGAWQAGAWRALAGRFQPDLIVGASVGSLNGYAIAGGASGDDLCNFWLDPSLMAFDRLPETIQELMRRFPLRTEYAAVLTDTWRLKPKAFLGPEITWRHLAASCAIPAVLPQYQIDGRWYSDGGLLNPLPLTAAVELGATHIVAFHPLWPSVTSLIPKWTVRGFRTVFGHNPPLPEGIDVVMLKPPRPLGSIGDALHWRRDNIERWLEQGDQAARNISLPNCIER